MHAILLLLPALLLILSTAVADVVLNEKIMKLTRTAAELSALAYEQDPPGSDFADFGFYDAEPDQAIVGRRNGYCFAAFRGITPTWDDWKQMNLILGNEKICHRDECCTTRTGFYQAYNAKYRDELEAEVRECAKTCANPDECVVLTGHSLGGAIAAVSSLTLADLNPYVITFGQPPTIDSPCPLISSDRWYRFVNTKASQTLNVGISYDPVSFIPGLGAYAWGHMILLSDDSSGVAYIGLDIQDNFGPLDLNGFQAHSMFKEKDSPYPGYIDRLDALRANATFPIRTNGFKAGALCTENRECETNQCGKEVDFSYARCIGTECKKNKDCDTDRCDNGVCLPKLGSCQPCKENSDCASNTCTWKYKCTNMDGLMDDECECSRNSDCVSGRCEGLVNSICEAKLPDGSHCNEDSDCLSNQCSWQFKCSNTLSTWADHREVDITRQTKQHAPLSHWEGIVAIAAVALAGYFALRWYYTRRQGYDEIPTQLNV